MAVADILILEPDERRREEVRQLLADLSFNAVVSASIEDTVERAALGDLELVIADLRALTDVSTARGDSLTLSNRIRASLAHIRASHARTAFSPSGRLRPLGIILTASAHDSSAHAAAISAGADAYLRAEDVREPGILQSYIVKLMDSERAGVLESVGRVAPPVEAPVAGIARPPEARRHVAEAFVLGDETLRNEETGRWSAARIADALGVPLKEFAGMIGANYSTVHKTPDSTALQKKLAPFANFLAMALDYLGGDVGRLRKWLNQPQPRLSGAAPLEALRTPANATPMEQWMSGIWLGEGE